MKLLFKKLTKKLKSKLPPSVFFKKLSYSQCGEDLIVKYIFDRLKINKPTYIDIGAHHPYNISNSALFYRNGSKGINIEPDPLLFRFFKNARNKDINLNIGISDKKDILNFFIISDPVLNTFSEEEANNYEKQGLYFIKEVQKVEVNTLQNIINDYSNGVFPDFLSLDAEGIDEDIIRSIDFKNNFPVVICVETISFSTNGNGVKNTALIDFITSNGYLLYADTNINSIFVRESLWRR